MKRKASSPVVAEVILIFVTVIVAVPLGGFLYDSLGNYTKTADVSVNSVNCIPTMQNTTDCTLNLDNLGTSNAMLKPSAYLLIFYGHSTSASYSNTCRGLTGDTIIPGSSLIVDCQFSVQAGLSGSRFTGWVALETGQNLPFAGAF